MMISYGRTPQPTTYFGNCHCGLIMFTVTLPFPLNQSHVTSCNCSICTRNGYIIVATKTENIEWHAGEALLRTYRFGNRNRGHKFCHQCGTSVLMDGSEDKRPLFQDQTFINIRTFVGIEEELPRLSFGVPNGRVLGRPYDEPWGKVREEMLRAEQEEARRCC